MCLHIHTQGINNMPFRLVLSTINNNNNSNVAEASNQATMPLTSSEGNQPNNTIVNDEVDKSEKNNLPGTTIHYNEPTSTKGNLKDDELHIHSPSNFTVNYDGNSCIANQSSPVNVTPKKLNFLPCDKGGKSNSSNDDDISIIDLASDESVVCFVDQNNKDEFVDDNESTLNSRNVS